MGLALQTLLCCCVFTSVLPLVSGATGEPDSSPRKRFKVWLQSRARRDLSPGAASANEQDSDGHVTPRQEENPTSASAQFSFGLSGRPRRSTSPKASGCFLVTCVYHDLLHRLQKISSKNPVKAPEVKMSSTGYGRRRRRRSLLYVPH